VSYFNVIPSSFLSTSSRTPKHSKTFMLVDDVVFDRNEFNQLGLANDNSNYGISTTSLFQRDCTAISGTDLNEIIEDLTGVHK